MTHTTEEIAIKSAHVDKGIIPLVKYLNSFNGIQTIYSCEGRGDGDDIRASEWLYVVFTAEDFASLRRFLETITMFSFSVSVGFYNEFVPFRFTIQFGSCEQLKRCQSEIEAHLSPRKESER